MGRTPIILLCQFIANPYIYLCINELLRREDIDVTVQDKDGNNALQTLCIGSYRHQTSIQVLMKAIIEHIPESRKKIVINVKNRNGWNALHILCFHNRDENLFDLIKLLVENGIDINAPNSKGSNALHILCVHHKGEDLIDIVRYLIDKGIKVKTEENGGWNVLLNLCRYYKGGNLKEIIELLLDKDRGTDDGIDVNHKTSCGWNALQLLCHHYEGDNLIEIIGLLIGKGIQVDEKVDKLVSFDKHGQNIYKDNDSHWNALHLLCSNSHQVNNLNKSVECLIENERIAVTSITSGGWNALHILCNNYKGEKCIEIATLFNFFINKGIVKNQKTKDGNTAFQLFIKNHSDCNMIAYILKNVFEEKQKNEETE
jgi:ankyrin repeat protein